MDELLIRNTKGRLAVELQRGRRGAAVPAALPLLWQGPREERAAAGTLP